MEPASKVGMSPEIVGEALFMLQALFLGLVLYFLYDCLRVFRRVVAHGKLSTGVEDFLYWMLNTYLIFKLLFKYNYGIIRWFVILGVACGMLVCKLTLGNWFVKYSSKCIKKIFSPIKKVIISIKKSGKDLQKMARNSRVLVSIYKRKGGPTVGAQKKKKKS